jgi:hypothetical protein
VRRLGVVLAAGAVVCSSTGCGSGAGDTSTSSIGTPESTVHLPPDVRPIPFGQGPEFKLAAVSTGVVRRETIGGLRCQTQDGKPFAIHLELFARRLVVPVPAGIGVAPPQQRRGAYVIGGACSYGIRTLEPTGVVLVHAGATRRLADLFAVWGQPLETNRLARFSGPVHAFVNGRRWTRAPGSIPLRRHAEIVLEVGGYVVPHPHYRFPPGL